MSKCDRKGFLKCDGCGKEFLKPVSTIYKIQRRGHTDHFCSYTCYNSALDEKTSYRGNK